MGSSDGTVDLYAAAGHTGQTPIPVLPETTPLPVIAESSQPDCIVDLTSQRGEAVAKVPTGSVMSNDTEIVDVCGARSYTSQRGEAVAKVPTASVKSNDTEIVDVSRARSS